MQVQEMTIEQLKAFVRQSVEERLEELLGDPDLGFQLKDSVRERLENSLRETEQGVRGLAPEDAAKKTGLRW